MRGWSVLALAALLVAAFLVRSPLTARFGGASAAQRVVTGIGERRVVTLSDGSRIDLGVATALVHPTTFSSTRRAVTLSGEAFFIVVADSARPFIVTAAHSAVESRGASAFGIRAYAGQGPPRVVVAEGVVKIRLASAPDTAGKRVAARQLAQITRDGAVSRQDSVNVERLTAWRRGRIVFAGAPLRDVLTELGRWQDVDLRIGDSVVANRRVTAEFTTTQTLTEVLDAIALGIGAVYHSEGRVVTFRRDR